VLGPIALIQGSCPFCFSLRLRGLGLTSSSEKPIQPRWNALSSTRWPIAREEPIAPKAAMPAATKKSKQPTGRNRDDGFGLVIIESRYLWVWLIVAEHRRQGLSQKCSELSTFSQNFYSRPRRVPQVCRPWNVSTARLNAGTIQRWPRSPIQATDNPVVTLTL
jgi:hypothetical protein